VQTRLEIAKLHQQLNTTIVYVTHDQVEAMTLGDKIVVMHEGRVQQAGSPLQLYQQPCNQFVATFIGSPKMNLLPARVVSGSASGVLLQLQTGPQVQAAVDGSGLAPGSTVMLGLRAEHALEEATADAEAFSGRVNMVEHLGEANMLYLTLDHGVDVVVRGDGNRAVDVGAPLRFWVPRDSFHVFDANGQALRRLRPGNLVASSRAAVAAAAVAA
jgi:multiple sugar transport system ATP-binding protein